MDKNPLVGRTIESIQMTSDKKAIRFILEGGEEVVAHAYGDCCSSTWIEHISLPVLGFPAAVTSARDIDMPDLGTPPDAESVAYYGFKVGTDKGPIVIDYRNESNGYYGGSLVWPGEHFYGGAYGQNVANDEWIEVKEDEFERECDEVEPEDDQDFDRNEESEDA